MQTAAADEFPSVPRYSIGPELEELFSVAYASREALLLVGETGIGKSEFVRSQAERLGCRLVVLNLALLEGPGELLGLQRIQGDRTCYARPDFLPSDGSGILLLEELTRGLPFVLAGLYELLTARRIGDYELPPGWMIVACANPPGPDYDGNLLDKAMLARFLRLEVFVDREAWIGWAETHGIHAALLAMARADSRLFALQPPRTWATASRYLENAEKQALSRRATEHMLAALFTSVEVAQAVMTYLSVSDPPQSIGALDVLACYAVPDGQLAARVRSWLSQGRTDLLDTLAYEVGEIVRGDKLAPLIARGGFRLEAFQRFLEDLPGDKRDELQRALGANPASAALVDVDPSEVLLGDRRKSLFRQAALWRLAGLGHRLGALAHRVGAYLEELVDAGGGAVLVGDPGVRRGLEWLAVQVGAEQGRPLLAVLRRVGIEPEPPEAS